MQKFIVAPEHIYDSAAPDEGRELTEMYYAGQVDTRIAQLESALKACAFVISRHIEATEVHVRQSRETLLEADRALALMERRP